MYTYLTISTLVAHSDCFSFHCGSSQSSSQKRTTRAGTMFRCLFIQPVFRMPLGMYHSQDVRQTGRQRLPVQTHSEKSIHSAQTAALIPHEDIITLLFWCFFHILTLTSKCKLKLCSNAMSQVGFVGILYCLSLLMNSQISLSTAHLSATFGVLMVSWEDFERDRNSVSSPVSTEGIPNGPVHSIVHHIQTG